MTPELLKALRPIEKRWWNTENQLNKLLDELEAARKAVQTPELKEAVKPVKRRKKKAEEAAE